MTAAAIRRADAERDAAVCAEIYAPHVSDGATSFEEQPPSPAQMRERIQAARAWLVADVGEVVGFAYATPHRSRPAYRWAVEVSVYVGEGHRGEGHGRRLYDSLFAELRERNYRIACAGITLPNEASVRLHEALGFLPVGVYRRIGWKLGAWRDVGWWQLELSPPAEGTPSEPL